MSHIPQQVPSHRSKNGSVYQQCVSRRLEFKKHHLKTNRLNSSKCKHNVNLNVSVIWSLTCGEDGKILVAPVMWVISSSQKLLSLSEGFGKGKKKCDKQPSLHVAEVCVCETERKRPKTFSFLPSFILGEESRGGQRETPLWSICYSYNEHSSNPTVNIWTSP